MKSSSAIFILTSLIATVLSAPAPNPDIKYVAIPGGSFVTLPDGTAVEIPQDVHVAISSKVKRGSDVDAISANDYEDYGFIKYKNKLAKKDPEPVAKAALGSDVDAVSANDYEDYGFIKYKTKLAKE